MKCQLIWSSSGNESSLEFEPGTDLETLKYVVFSILPDTNNNSNDFESSSSSPTEVIVDPDSLLFLDYCGREITSDEDLQSTILENQPYSSSISESNDNSWYFTIYCMNKVRLDQSICTRSTFQSQEIVQPGYRLVDTDFLFCYYCQQFIDPSLIVSETRSLTRFSCRYEEAAIIGLCQTISASSIASHKGSTSDPSSSHPEIVHSHRLLFERALHRQSYYPQVITSQRQRFDARLASGSATILSYENTQWQDRARSVIDYQAIRTYASEKMATEPTLAKYV